MAKKAPENLSDFSSLLEIMTTLAGPDGCPWDIEQTHQTLIPYLIEETHEAVEAIESGKVENIYEELGDVLLQVVFHAELGRKSGSFDIKDVISSINEKMIRRHPHIFSDTKADTAEQVKKNWDQIKATEKAGESSKEILGGPLGAPALQRSHKIGEKTHQKAFDWKNSEGVWTKLDEEIVELQGSIKGGNKKEMEHELGDVLFTLAQLARHLNLDAEASLRQANRRFESRFFKMMKLAKNKNLDWSKLTDKEKEGLWQAIK